ncbi:MAG: SMP-30/gluconolactonase/LRE family protein [Coriobacteriia bacterium]
MFSLIAVVLAIVLVALLAYLFLYLNRGGVPEPQPTSSPGVEAVLQIYGPAEGDRPSFDGPMGVVASDDGRIYVTDSGNNRVCEFDAQGRFVREFGSFGVAKPSPGATASYEPGSLNYPVGIDLDADGNVYVASFYNDSIEVFDAEGTPLRRFPDPESVVGKGSSGFGGRGIAVTDVAVRGDLVYAVDAYQVVVFTLEGEFVSQWGKPGNGPGDLDRPNGIAVSNDGQRVYVSDSNHARVIAFTSDGEVLWQVGTSPEGMKDDSDRPIQLPRGLCVEDDGSILVADAFSFEVVRISPDGEVLARYGARGVDPGQWNFANDVSIFRGFALVADKGNGRVQMVRFTGR